MKTLTITEAKKNLGKWLNAAVAGKDIGIISGAAIVALRRIEVRPASISDQMPIDYGYAWKEYGITPAELDAFSERMEAGYRSAKAKGKVLTMENPTLEKLEKAIADHAAAPKTARRTPKKRAVRRTARTV